MRHLSMAKQRNSSLAMRFLDSINMTGIPMSKKKTKEVDRGIPWPDIRNDFIYGKRVLDTGEPRYWTLSDLSTKYNVNTNTLSNRAYQEGWLEKRVEAEDETNRYVASKAKKLIGTRVTACHVKIAAAIDALINEATRKIMSIAQRNADDINAVELKNLSTMIKTAQESLIMSDSILGKQEEETAFERFIDIYSTRLAETNNQIEAIAQDIHINLNDVADNAEWDEELDSNGV